MQADQRAKAIRLLALDVDGTLTDGRIIIGSRGEMAKAFSVHDGQGIRLLIDSGIDVALVTGRESKIVRRRARELGIKQVLQGVGDKATAMESLSQTFNIELNQTAFMGDDLPDICAMACAGLAACVADAPAEVQQAAHWQSDRRGGHGAVRELVEFILKAQQLWPSAISRFGVR